MKVSVLIFVFFIISSSSYADDTIENESFIKRWWNSARDSIIEIYDEGKNDVYLPFYAYHDRNTYTKEKLRDLNEGAYGLGAGRTRVNESGNTEMLYAMAHLDSHSDVQVNVGYAWVKKFKIIGNSKIGIGYTAAIVSRSDFAGRLPIPIAFPMMTIDVGDVSVNGVLIPKLNNGINNGNVLFIFAKFSWDQK